MPASRAANPFVRSIALVVGVGRRKRFRLALIGGFALPFHGVQRATRDVDFLADSTGSPTSTGCSPRWAKARVAHDHAW
jgi:hypothetical protein